MWNDLVDADPTSKILTAWIAKEELRRLLACARTGGQRHEISARLHRFNAWCPDSRLPELERLAGAIEASSPVGLGLLETRNTNPGTGATNADREARGAHRLWLPKPGQPTPPGTVRLHPAPPPGHRPLRGHSPSRSKSRQSRHSAIGNSGGTG